MAAAARDLEGLRGFRGFKGFKGLKPGKRQAKGRLQCRNADGQELGGSCREGCAGKGQAATLCRQRAGSMLER